MVRAKRGFYDRLAVGAFLFVPLALAVVRTLMAVTGSAMPSGQIQPLYVVSVVSIVLAAAYFSLGYRTRWISAPVIAVAIILLLAALFLGSWGLQHPDSFFDFVPGFVMVAGPLVAIVAIFVGRHRHRTGPVTLGGHRQHVVIGTLVALFVVAAAASGAKTALARRRLQLPRGAVVVYAENNRFRPDEVRGVAGRILTIAVVNHDSYSHVLAPEASQLLTSNYIGPLTTKIIKLRVASGATKFGHPKANIDRFSCDVTGHDGMNGTIEVAER